MRHVPQLLEYDVEGTLAPKVKALRALVQAAVRCARGTTTLTVDTYNAQALALYCRCGFDVYGTLAVCERTRLTPKDPAAYPGLVVRRAKTSDLHACIKLADHYANTAMEREIQAHAETAWVVTQDDVVLGYCAALDMSGHSVFSMTLAAEALLGAVCTWQKFQEGEWRRVTDDGSARERVLTACCRIAEKASRYCATPRGHRTRYVLSSYHSESETLNHLLYL